MNTKLSRLDIRSEYNYILLFADILAVFCISALSAFPNFGNFTAAISLLSFFVMSFIYAYLKRFRVSIMFLWAVAFYGFCALSTLWANYPQATNRYWPLTYGNLAMVFSILFYADNRRNILFVMKSFLVGATLLAIRLLINTPFDDIGMIRLGKSIEMNENTVGLLFLFSSTISLYFTKRSKWYFLAYIFFTALSLLSGSRKAVIMIFVVLIITFVNKIEKPSNILYVIPFGAAIAALIYLLLNNAQLYQMVGRRIEYIFNYFNGEGDVGRSTLTRMNLIDLGLELFKEKPILGYGYNNFRYLNRYGLYAHNNYIELLVNSGIIGVVLFYSAHILILIRAVMIWFNKTRDVVIVIMFLAILLICDYGTVSYYSETSLALLALSFSIIALYDNEHIDNIALSTQ